MKTFNDVDNDILKVEDYFDFDGDLYMRAQRVYGGSTDLYFDRSVVTALRDHLTSVLGDEEPTPEEKTEEEVAEPVGFRDGLEGDVVVLTSGTCCVGAGTEVTLTHIRDGYYSFLIPGFSSRYCGVSFADCEFVRPAEGEFPEDDTSTEEELALGTTPVPAGYFERSAALLLAKAVLQPVGFAAAMGAQPNADALVTLAEFISQEVSP